MDCYDKEYSELGLSREDITAEFLNTAKELVELGVYSDVDILKVEEVQLINVDTEKDYEFTGAIDKCEISNWR